MKRFKCKICDYIHEGDEAPKVCSSCGAAQDEFYELIEGETVPK